MYIEVWFIHH